MKKERIVRYSMNEIMKMKGRTDWKRVDAIPDEDIDTSDIPELTDEFWKNARLLYPSKKKKMVSLRMDEDIIKWFKKQGVPYQSLMQAILKAYVESQRRN